MSRQLTSYVRAVPVHPSAAVSASAASTNTVTVGGARRASFLIDVGTPGAVSSTTDANLAVTIQHSLLDVSSDWAVGVATDISATTPPTTGTISWQASSDTGATPISDMSAGGLYWIDMNLNALGIQSGLLRAYMTLGWPASDSPAVPVDIIALMYDGDGGTPANSNVTTITQSYSST